ncbi:MAG: META domain-containing protein [Bacillota bacterium]
MKARIGIAALFALAGCASTPGDKADAAAQPAAASPASIVGRHWIGSAPGVDPKMQPRLEFLREGRITGYTGCNMLSGTWRAEGPEIRLGQVIATKRMCVGPEGEVESRVLPVLSPNTRVSVEGSKLVLEGANGRRFEFGEEASAR